MNKLVAVDESDCVSPFVQTNELTLYQAALLWTGRAPEAPFPFPTSADEERMDWLRACEKSDVENGKPSGSWSAFLNLAKAVEDALLPANRAFDRDGNHAPIRTVVRKSDLRKFAEKKDDELPDFLLDEQIGQGINSSPGTSGHGTKAELGKAKPGLTTGDIAVVFDGIYWDYDKWKSNLASCPNWAKSARLSPGLRGRGKQGSATWDPVELASQILEKNGKLKIQLNGAFEKEQKLLSFSAAWKERREQEKEYFG